MEIKIDLMTFYSKGDENRFFQGLYEISAIKEIKGIGGSLMLRVDLRLLSKEMLRELIALLWRYGIPLYPIAMLCKKEKFEWLADEKYYWHEKMFTS